MEKVAVAPGDGSNGEATLPDDVFADGAYRGQVFGSSMRARGGMATSWVVRSVRTRVA